jgi:hypothetical protein
VVDKEILPSDAAKAADKLSEIFNGSVRDKKINITEEPKNSQ